MKLRRFKVLVTGVAALILLINHAGVPQEAEASDPPNIVFILTDDQDTDSMPAMRQLMSYPSGSWVNFTNAFTAVPLCGPSRATILTGQNAHTHGVISNELGDDELVESDLLPVWLDNAGYTTALIGKYRNNYPWGREPYTPPGWDTFRVDLGDNVDIQTQAGIDFLETAEGPFFLYLSYSAPHKPAAPGRYRDAPTYVPPPRPNVNEADVADKTQWVRSKPLLTEDQLLALESERLNSQRELLAIDDGVQLVVDTLVQRGLLDNTVIVFTSDNGFSWGAHRWDGKFCPYEECARVPFVVRYPGLDGNRDEPRLVSNVDIAATLAEIAGATPLRTQEGRSIVPLITNTAVEWPDEVLLEKRFTLYYAIRTPRWKYIEYHNGERELYDLESDPYEMQNLAGLPEHGEIQADLALRLNRLMGFSLIAGVVTDATGAPVEDVKVSIGSQQRTTDALGRYEFEAAAPGAYTLEASKAGMTFSPPSLSVSVPPNASGSNFVSDAVQTYSIVGTVTRAGAALSGVVVSAGAAGSATTDANGRYQFTGLSAGTYVLTPALSGATFTPASRTVTLPPGATAQSFQQVVPVTHTVTGTITRNGVGLGGVVVSDGAGHTATTASTGRYTLRDLPPGTVTLTPGKAGFTFTPASRTITLPPNAVAQSFSAKAITAPLISGLITRNGVGMSGVLVSTDTGQSVITGSSGRYNLRVPGPGTYTITPAKTGYTFTPLSRTVVVPPNRTGQNFRGAR